MFEGVVCLVLPRYDLTPTDADGRRSRVYHDCIPNNPDLDPEHEPPPPALEKRLGGVITDLSELEKLLERLSMVFFFPRTAKIQLLPFAVLLSCAENE